VQVALSPTSPNLTKVILLVWIKVIRSENVHCSVERIASHNHVKMSGREGAGLGRWVEPLRGQGRAWETKAGLGMRDEGGQKPQRWRENLHLGRVGY
jgi:hypothetical protein